MNREFSAGGIVIKGEMGKTQVLLIKNMAMRDPLKSYWGFPKGHLNEGEGSKEAAIREVKEEVGLDAEIIEKVGQSSYVFKVNGEKVFKIVTIFLMKADKQEITIQDLEIQDAKWVDTQEAFELLSFPNDKNLLEKALNIYGK
jgi:8-oxo-dGTP pyrophosphatase MutT (NUDIX family)